MKATITVRLDDRQQRAVSEAARRLGMSVSDVVRDALDRTLTDRTVAAKAGHVKGRLRLPRAPRSAWRRSLKERNWRA